VVAVVVSVGGVVVSVEDAGSVTGTVDAVVVLVAAEVVGRGVRVRVRVRVLVLLRSRELVALVVLPTGTTTGAVVATPPPGCPPAGAVGAPGGLASGYSQAVGRTQTATAAAVMASFCTALRRRSGLDIALRSEFGERNRLAGWPSGSTSRISLDVRYARSAPRGVT
jgi:hypothetical protein